MASNSLTQHARFVEMMCEEAEPNFPYQTDELEAALNEARHLLTLQQVDAIWEAAMTMLSTATEQDGDTSCQWQKDMLLGQGNYIMTFDFDKDGISCTSPHVTLAPGDKVTRVRFGAHGARFFQKGIVKKVNPKKVTVDIRLRGRLTGEIRWQSVTVDKQYLYRYNWTEEAA